VRNCYRSVLVRAFALKLFRGGHFGTLTLMCFLVPSRGGLGGGTLYRNYDKISKQIIERVLAIKIKVQNLQDSNFF
jgi:hypothetical protein